MAQNRSSTKNILSNLQESADKSPVPEKIQKLIKKYPKVEKKLNSFFLFLGKHRESDSKNYPFTTDDALIALIEANPKSVNRILDLYKALMISDVPLTEELYQIVSNNLAYAGSFESLLTFLHELNIDIRDLDMNLLASASQFVEPLKYAINSYITSHGSISTDSLLLMLKFPEHATEIGKLLVDLQQYTYNTKTMETSLSQIPPQNIGAVLLMLSYLLQNNVLLNKPFLTDALDLLTKHPEHVESVYKGIVKLSTAEMLSEGYFKAVAVHPENANILAKNIILLSKDFLVNPNNSEDINKINELGRGAYYLFEHLEASDGLNEESYKTVCTNSPLLADQEIIDTLHSLPIFVTLNPDDVTSLLNILAVQKPSSQERDAFLNVLHKYQLGSLYVYQ
ncbi:hypothetical protein [Legionella shakespearei]|uniref:Uncharacterized protein n=1 Tax=Legionella shakespearei DSM 23087 TaxID=1122169 RepID=A0A0W0Z2G3_9GAMM|nr:hypothetical protein [Legionella shakespearei]KTD63341.1 hypothetical protein Lsha_0761 [Legionella shakespearei DSM 23087]